jgi:hypothetical protein
MCLNFSLNLHPDNAIVEALPTLLDPPRDTLDFVDTLRFEK